MNDEFEWIIDLWVGLCGSVFVIFLWLGIKSHTADTTHKPCTCSNCSKNPDGECDG